MRAKSVSCMSDTMIEGHVDRNYRFNNTVHPPFDAADAAAASDDSSNQPDVAGTVVTFHSYRAADPLHKIHCPLRVRLPLPCCGTLAQDGPLNKRANIMFGFDIKFTAPPQLRHGSS